jgi:hypothetical protein
MESVREMIERRAYQLFLERGGEHGYHIQDWLQAERDTLGTLEPQQKSGGNGKSQAKAAAAPAPAPAKKRASRKKA